MTELLDIGFAHDRTTGKEDWLTPPHVLKVLGKFDLDPCSPVGRPWDTAIEHYTVMDNGLNKPWKGRVWLNPPYGNQTEQWMKRLADHGDGIALIFARTETATFHPWVWQHADAMLFLRGRLRFWTKEGREGGSAGAPSVLVAYGADNAIALKDSGLDGHFLPLPSRLPREKSMAEWDRVERRKDNWTLLVQEYWPKLNFKYRDRDGREMTFFGLVYAEDDLYYGLMDKDGKVTLSSCVGSLDGKHGWYEQIPNGGRCSFCNDVYPVSGPVKCDRYRCPGGDFPFKSEEPLPAAGSIEGEKK